MNGEESWKEDVSGQRVSAGGEEKGKVRKVITMQGQEVLVSPADVLSCQCCSSFRFLPFSSDRDRETANYGFTPFPIPSPPFNKCSALLFLVHSILCVCVSCAIPFPFSSPSSRFLFFSYSAGNRNEREKRE